MSDTEDLPILLAVERNGNDLIVRLDLDGHSRHGAESAVTVLKLEDCQDVESRYRDLQESVAEIVEYEGGVDEVNFYVDYSRKEFTIECAKWGETPASLTINDLIVRSRSLAVHLESYAQRYYRESRHHSRLVAALGREAEVEIDRAQRKREFFRETNPSKADEMDALIGAWERVTAIIQEHRDNQAA